MELQGIIQEMDRLKTELDNLRPIPEERMGKLMQKLRLDWNYHSNSIEGNTLSASETKAFILHGITAKGKPFRDYIEMRGHNEALKKVEDIVHKDIRITESLIKELHRIILVEPYTDSQAEISPGSYKTVPNYLYSPTGERIDFVAPEEVAIKMNALVNWVNNHLDPPKRSKKQYDAHPLLIASIFHWEFIRIHPFGDGNGRMARILMNLILMTCGYVPSIVRLEKRNEYYAALNLSEANHMNPLAEFIGEECIESLKTAIRAAKGESIEEEDDLDKELFLLMKELGNQNILTLKASSINIHNVIQDNVIPLFSIIEEKCGKIQELFFETDIRMVSKVKGFHGSFLLKSTNIEWNGVENRLKQSRQDQEFIEQIQYTYTFNGFKKTLNAQSFSINITVHFDDFNYLLKSNYTDKAPVKLPYGIKLETQALKEISAPFIRGLMEDIKNVSAHM